MEPSTTNPEQQPLEPDLSRPSIKIEAPSLRYFNSFDAQGGIDVGSFKLALSKAPAVPMTLGVSDVANFRGILMSLIEDAQRDQEWRIKARALGATDAQIDRWNSDADTYVQTVPSARDEFLRRWRQMALGSLARGEAPFEPWNDTHLARMPVAFEQIDTQFVAAMSATAAALAELAKHMGSAIPQGIVARLRAESIIDSPTMRRPPRQAARRAHRRKLKARKQ